MQKSLHCTLRIVSETASSMIASLVSYIDDNHDFTDFTISDLSNLSRTTLETNLRNHEHWQLLEILQCSLISARNTAWQMVIKICFMSTQPGPFPGSDSPFLQTDEMTILAVVGQGHQDQTSIRIIPILVIQALDGGISSTNAIVVLHPPSSPLTYTSPLNMTIVSNDPSLLQVVDFDEVLSYVVGLWRVSRVSLVMSHSAFECGFAVAALTVVVYDVGEQDSTY